MLVVFGQDTSQITYSSGMSNVLLAAKSHTGLFIDKSLHLCTDAAYVIAYLLSVNEKIDPAIVT